MNSLFEDVPLRVERVTKSYDGVEVVRDISFTLQPGEIFGLLGPNGAGKSTTINMIVGVAARDSGSISVFGRDTETDYRVTRSVIGVMHQELIMEQFLPVGMALKLHAGYYGKRDDKEWRETLIDRLRLRPHLHKRFVKLSGGMKRRFMVAKSLLHRPRLLILDEPTAGVDVELRRSLWGFVREINEAGTTILLTTHYLEEAEEMCDRIAIMNHGEIVALEGTKELLSKIGEQRVQLSFAEPISGLPEGLKRFSPEVYDDAHSVCLLAGSAEDVRHIIGESQKLGSNLVNLQVAAPDLEDVFLLLTGGSK